ncbi:SET and MYND domain-containing protein 4 [Battus philenor]|uniref:SET and MYND domain-containing protein 4 n=1 Tax=Battus philenor TaxID=42288 RepID=UPI0035D0EC26
MSVGYEALDPAYAERCNNATLYSDRVGFIKNLVEDVIVLANGDNWLESFEGVAEDNKVKAVLENETMMEALKEVFSRIEPLYRGKDGKISNESRKSAEFALKNGDLKQALALASQAVLRSPMREQEVSVDRGVSLAHALWERSEILMKLNRYSAALEDLKLALKEHLPAKMRAQYYCRLGHCYKGAGELLKAKVSYEIAEKLLSKDNEEKMKVQQDIRAVENLMDPQQPPNEPGSEAGASGYNKIGISLTEGPHSTMPSLSRLLRINEDPIKGRFAVANEPVKTGDVVLVEKPYAACLAPDFYGTHCLHCFKRLEDCYDTAPVWCPKCSGVAFCSVDCKDKAIPTYHTYECPFLNLFIGSGMSMLCHLALRMITQVDLKTNVSIHSKYLLNSTNPVENPSSNNVETVPKGPRVRSRISRLERFQLGMDVLNNNSPFDNNMTFELNNRQERIQDQSINNASQVYTLCTHSAQRKGVDYLKRIVLAMFLTECLKKSNFFIDCQADELQNNEIAICELLVRNLLLLQFNAHEIYETVRGKHMFSGSKPLSTAIGVYPTGALFNHECCPAVARFYDGKNIVLRAVRPLAPGQMVSENYGPHFMVKNLEERQRSLDSRYWFRCDCTACKENWPTLKQMTTKPPFLRCPNTSCSSKFLGHIKRIPNKCNICSEPIDEKLVQINLKIVETCLAKYVEGAKLIEAERPQEAIEIISEAVDLYHGIACLPHHETIIAQDSLRSCYATMGNVHTVSEALPPKE